MYNFLRDNFLFKMDAEDAHDLVKSTGPFWKFLNAKYNKKDLECNFFGRTIQHPVGLSAGFDKNADLLSYLQDLGFSFVEIGSVSAKPHGGNPRPRAFRLPGEKALINRMGLNSEGADIVAERLDEYFSKHMDGIAIGANVVKTNNPRLDPEKLPEEVTEDICYTLRTLLQFPLSHITINISCPNSAEGVLKEMEFLTYLFDKIEGTYSFYKRQAMSYYGLFTVPRPALLLKLSPDSSSEFLNQVIPAAHCFDGFVCGNTTATRPLSQQGMQDAEKIGAGGLSGIPLFKNALGLVAAVSILKARHQKIIACGGIFNGVSAKLMQVAGADYIQLYTALVYKGPHTVKNICEQLSQINNSATLMEVVGGDNNPYRQRLRKEPVEKYQLHEAVPRGRPNGSRARQLVSRSV